MVLPDRIELSTSPLPRECSTTELRQRARDKESAQLAPASAAVLATSPPPAQARDRAAARKNIARAEIRPIRGAWFHAPTRERDFAGSSAIVPKTWGSTSPIDRCMALSAWSIVMRLWQVRKNGSSMQDEKDKQERQTATASRQHRLKLALRENLKRRKSQARGRGGLASSEPAEGRLDDASDGEPGR
jgi:hypothetical protein